MLPECIYEYNITVLIYCCVLMEYNTLYKSVTKQRDCLCHNTLIPYILESNPDPFYSFRRLKNQMRIRIACGLDSRSRAGFWKNDRAAVRAVRTIQYNNLLFYLLFIILYNTVFIIHYSSDSPSSLITESVCLVGKGRLKERCGLEPRTNFFFFRLRNRQKLVRIRFENIRY